MSNVDITTKGIQKILQKYNAESAIAEYIWNGFDAKADTISLKYSANEIGAINKIEIEDNGYGINLNKLSEKFNPFYDSEKAIEISNPKHTSAIHGKNGVGRLTFFKFANTAIWETVYELENKLHKGEIRVNAGNLRSYDPKEVENITATATGTKVTFQNVLISVAYFEQVVFPYLITEFCWFLELNKSKNYKIYINDELLDYSKIIADSDQDLQITYKDGEPHFKFTFVQWKAPLHKELSKYYFLNSNNEEVYKDFTTLNKKGDDFFHSVYIQSSFFDNFDFNSIETEEQGKLYGKAKSSLEYKYLIKKINDYLRGKRKPFLKLYATKLVEDYEQNGIFPTYQNEWEKQYKKPILTDTLVGLYEAQPKLFNSLNVSQKKTFVRFLDLLLDSNEREQVFTVLEEIIDLDAEERQELADLFKTTRLNRIIATIKLIEDRYRTYYSLRELVFNTDLRANEVNHLQKVIENHYWLFGEQFHLVTAAEPKFDEALRRYHYLLYQEDVDRKLTHPDKYKEMDIFACRQNVLTDKIENIVVELKHPEIKIGRNQYIQVDKYLQTILSEPLFNAGNMSWEFYLIAKDFDGSGFLEREIESKANHGIKSLIHWSDKGRIKVYAKRWSEIFAEFEIRHKFLDEKLQFEKQKLYTELRSADDIVASVQGNKAVIL